MNTLLPAPPRLFNAAKTTGKLFLLVFALLFCFSAGAKTRALTSQTITFHAIAPVTYGAGDFSPNATASSGLAVSYASDNHAVATIVNNEVHIVGAGTAHITASQAGNGTYKAANNISQTLTVNTAPLTVTATDTTKTYGTLIVGAPGSSEFTSSGLLNGETIGSVTIDYYSGALATDGIGDYVQCVAPSAATGGTFNANNYNITYVAADIIVNPATLTITANDTTKVYGNVLNGGAGLSAFTAVGLQNGETVGTVTIAYSTGSAATDSVGSFVGCVAITATAGGTYDPDNYNINFVAGNINVVPAPLTITGITISDKGFDGTTAAVIVGNPQLNGVLNGDNIVLVTDTATAVFITAAAGSNIPVTVTGYGIDGTAPFNYTLVNPTGLTANILGASTDNLASLLPGAGTLSPAFTTTTLAYTDTVSAATASITLTPMTADTNATVTVNGTAVTSGSPSAAVSLTAGQVTNIPVVVLAQDATTTETYTVAVFRQPGADATLSGLAPGSGTLNPAFAPGTLAYTDTVGSTVNSITLTPTSTDVNASILVNGASVTSGSPSQSISLTQGQVTNIPVAVTGQDGITTDNYTVAVFQAVPTDATLSNLSTPGSTPMAPAFNPDSLNYTRNVVNGVKTIAVTATASDPDATIMINGTPVASGTASSPISLNVGPNTITILVTSHDNSATQTYTLTVIRGGAKNDNLASVKLSRGVLSPSFTHLVVNYTASVVHSVTSTTLTAVLGDTNASILLNDTTALASGAASDPIPLSVGANVITLGVTAQDGSTAKTYTITVTRAASANANLAAFKISRGALTPFFNVGTTSYSASVVNGVSSMTVTPTTVDTTATVTVNGTPVTSGTASGPIALNAGANTITTVVTAQDGSTTKTYTLTVTRAPSTNAHLSAFKISRGTLTPYFSSANTSYTANVANVGSSMTVTPTATDPTATITVNGTPVASGAASQVIELAVGPNTITTVVTAQDSTTQQTYTLTVTRAEGAADSFDQGISVSKPTEAPSLNDDVILVHQGLSPNGDGINDFLVIDGIQAYPNNKLSIMNRNGQLVYEANGYDNSSKIFDGHSNKNGQMQLPGTYFYQLDYTVKGITKHKTGFIVVKY